MEEKNSIASVINRLQDPTFKKEIGSLIAAHKNKKIFLIKEIRKRYKLGLKDAKELADNLSTSIDYYDDKETYGNLNPTEQTEFIEKSKSNKSFQLYALVFLIVLIIYYLVTKRY